MIARSLTALVALGAMVGALAWKPPSEAIEPQAAPSEFEVAAVDLPLACPGRVIPPLGDTSGGGDTSGAGSLDPDESPSSHEVLTSDGERASAIGAGFASPSDVATEMERVSRGDLAGLAAAACEEPRLETWLVGGSTRIGDSARLVLTNPADTTTVVSVTIYGPTGAIDQPLVRSVGPGAQESLLLEGVAVDLASLVVHVKADGAGVVAAIQDSRLDGFQPAGTDWVLPAADPARQVVLPGVGPSDPASPAGPAVLRMMAPDGARVTLTLVDETGEVPWPGTSSLALEPGVPVDIDLPASTLGSVFIDASSPVIAAAVTRIARAPEEGRAADVARDLAWVRAQVPVAPGLWRAVVPGFEVAISAYAYEVTRFRAVDAVTGTIYVEWSLGKGQTVTIPLGAPEGTVLRVEGDVVWSLRVTDDPGFLASITPTNIAHPATSVTVWPGVYAP